jgi:hypothetical protein
VLLDIQTLTKPYWYALHTQRACLDRYEGHKPLHLLKWTNEDIMISLSHFNPTSSKQLEAPTVSSRTKMQRHSTSSSKTAFLRRHLDIFIIVQLLCIFSIVSTLQTEDPLVHPMLWFTILTVFMNVRRHWYHDRERDRKRWVEDVLGRRDGRRGMGGPCMEKIWEWKGEFDALEEERWERLKAGKWLRLLEFIYMTKGFVGFIGGLSTGDN